MVSYHKVPEGYLNALGNEVFPTRSDIPHKWFSLCDGDCNNNPPDQYNSWEEHDAKFYEMLCWRAFCLFWKR